MRGWRLGLAAAALSLPGAGCTVLTSSKEYQELSLQAELERLAPGCGACMARSCSAFGPCASDAECVEYAACRVKDKSPAGYPACGVPDDDYQSLLNCPECNDACRSGENWDCLGNYVWSRVDGPIRFRQRLLDNPAAGTVVGGLSGVRVQACGHGDVSCALGSKVNGITDEEGWVELALPNGKEGLGFDGYLLASGDQVPTFRIHRSIRLGTMEAETELFSTSSLQRIVSGNTIGAELPAIDPLKPHAVFQIFDCLHQPAPGVSVGVVEVPEADRVISYNDDAGGEGLNFESTTRRGRGTGAIFNLSRTNLEQTSGLRRIEFSKGGERLGYALVTLSPGDITVALLEPSHEL